MLATGAAGSIGRVVTSGLTSLGHQVIPLDVVPDPLVGSFLPRPTTVRHLSTWLSPDDCVRKVEASLTTHRPGYAVLYGISATNASPRASMISFERWSCFLLVGP